MLGDARELKALSAKNSPLLLRNVSWKCCICCREKGHTAYIRSGSDTKEWYSRYFEHIIAPSVLRVCRACAGNIEEENTQKVRCAICGPLERSEFSASMLHNRATPGQRTLCNDCVNPRCTAVDCQTCKVCRDANCSKNGNECKGFVTPLHQFQFPTSKDHKQRFRCQVCEGTLKCTICGPLPRDSFKDSDLTHRWNKDRLFCLDCRHPQCSMEGCKTCRTCRNVECSAQDNKRKCLSSPAPLHKNKQPHDAEQKMRFVCERCQYRCSNPGCPKLVLKHRRRSAPLPWTCGDCENQAFSAAVFRENKKPKQTS